MAVGMRHHVVAHPASATLAVMSVQGFQLSPEDVLGLVEEFPELLARWGGC
jgi:hypothetical protein